MYEAVGALGYKVFVGRCTSSSSVRVCIRLHVRTATWVTNHNPSAWQNGPIYILFVRAPFPFLSYPNPNHGSEVKKGALAVFVPVVLPTKEAKATEIADGGFCTVVSKFVCRGSSLRYRIHFFLAAHALYLSGLQFALLAVQGSFHTATWLPQRREQEDIVGPRFISLTVIAVAIVCSNLFAIS